MIIVGLGAPWARRRCIRRAKAARKSLGIDRFEPPHTLGSSHGDTRITRSAIGEGEFYVPLVRRSDEIWRELEASSGRALFHRSGGLIIAPPSSSATFHGEGDFVEASARVAGRHGIKHEVIDADGNQAPSPAAEAARNRPRLLSSRAPACLRPERCMSTQLDLARGAGATIRTGEKVTGYDASADCVTVTSERGSYRADKLILSAGAWMADLVPESYPRRHARLPPGDLLV